VQTVYDGERCVACGRCADACPQACLTFASPADVSAGGFAAPAGSVLLLKDETACLRCGLCAERCPTGAMTMERYEARTEEAAAAAGAAT
jgi:formate hydrogenlyase subunit 6/NADH:ubiquinone oxidoreductase subunit I